ncbi:MAG: hypothetical protein PHT94_02270 [Candidatus Nanoarchaeia archaeon]|nr:hypothetical protein [Candidatus Nanoarchaeia archaeon]
MINNKKSQMTVFVIVGLIIIISSIIFLTFRDTSIETQIKTENEIIKSIPIEFLNVYYSIRDLGNDFLKEALKTVASNGGILEWEAIENNAQYRKFVLENNNRKYLNYYFYDDKNCQLEIFFPALNKEIRITNPQNIANTDPSISIDEQIERYFETEFISYIEKKMNGLGKQGYKINIKSDPVSTVLFKDNLTQMYFKMFIEVEYQDKIFNMNEFYVDVKYDFKGLYLSALDLLNTSINKKQFETFSLGYMQYELSDTFGVTNEINVVMKPQEEEKAKRFLKFINVLSAPRSLSTNLDLSALDEQTTPSNIITRKVFEIMNIYTQNTYSNYYISFSFLESLGINFDLNNGAYVSISSPLNLFGDSNPFSGLFASLMESFNVNMNQNYYSFDIPILTKVQDFNYLDSEMISYEFILKPRVNKNGYCNSSIQLNLNDNQQVISNDISNIFFGYLSSPSNRLLESKSFKINLKDIYGNNIDGEISTNFICGQEIYNFKLNSGHEFNLPSCVMGGELQFLNYSYYIPKLENVVVLDDSQDVEYNLTANRGYEMNLFVENVKIYEKIKNVATFEKYLYDIASEFSTTKDSNSYCKYNGYPVIYKPDTEVGSSYFISLLSLRVEEYLKNQNVIDPEKIMDDLDFDKFMQNLSFFYIDCELDEFNVNQNNFNYSKILNITYYYNSDLYDKLNSRCQLIDCKNISNFNQNLLDSLNEISYYDNYINLPSKILDIQFDYADQILEKIETDYNYEIEDLCNYDVIIPSITENPMICQYDYIDKINDLKGSIAVEVKSPIYEDVEVNLIMIPEDQDNILGVKPNTIDFTLKENEGKNNYSQRINISHGSYKVTIITTYLKNSTIKEKCLKKPNLGMKIFNFFSGGSLYSDNCLATTQEFNVTNPILGMSNFILTIDESFRENDEIVIPNFINHPTEDFNVFIESMNDLGNFSKTYGKLSGHTYISEIIE